MANILIIDDDIVDLMAIKRHLKSFTTHQFTFASSLKEANQLVAQHAFDIIFTDYHLGDGTALELNASKSSPTILLTGMNELPADIIEARFDNILIKTIKNDHLHQIGNIIQSRFGGPDIAISSPPPQILPLEQLSLSFKDDPSYFQIMLIEMKTQFEQAITNIKAIEKHDSSAYFELSHKLKSQFNLGGFNSEAQMASKLEQLSKSSPENTSEIIHLVDSLQQVTQHAIKLIDKKLNEIA